MMNRLMVWFAIILFALSGVAYADTSTGYSNAFTINNDAAAPAAVPAQAVSAHTSSNGNLLRGQVHAHFINGGKGVLFPDSHLSPQIVVVSYKNLGYQFVAVTEHDYIATPPSAAWQSTFGTIVPRGCEEISTGCTKVDLQGNRTWDWNAHYCHILALGMDQSGPGEIIPINENCVGFEEANREREIVYGSTNTFASRNPVNEAVSVLASMALGCILEVAR